MRPETALYKSIKEKWEPGLQGKVGWLSRAGNCECCYQYYSRVCMAECEECPIAEDGHHNCLGTPYYEFDGLWEFYYEEDIWELHAEVNAAAQWELDYLKGLYRRLTSK